MRDALAVLDPCRADRMRANRLRRRVYDVKGPNHIWHLDGNDKLKPFGICVHGCMDGFSRKVPVWERRDR